MKQFLLIILCATFATLGNAQVNACYHISNDKEGYEVWQFKDGDFVKVSERVEELKD